MSRWFSALLFAAGLLCAPVAIAQSIIVPGGAGGGCPSTTPCTVQQLIQPALTADNGLSIDLPNGTTSTYGFRIRNNGVQKALLESNGYLTLAGSVEVPATFNYKFTGRAILGACDTQAIGITQANQNVGVCLGVALDQNWIQLGGKDSAGGSTTPVTFTSVAGGTTNTAGSNQLIKCPRGTGTGAGGSCIFQVAPAGSTGSTQNTLVDAFEINQAIHLISKGTAPALTSCGTSPTIAGTDTAGRVTEGSVATGCVITFNKAFGATPACVVTSEAGLVFSYTTSTTAITVTNVGALSSTILNYHCIG